MKEPCRIKINYEDKEIPIDMETGDISYFEIVDALNTLLRHCSEEIVKVAEKKCGPNWNAQEKWINEKMNEYVKRPYLGDDHESQE